MTKKQLKEFESTLLTQKEELIKRARSMKASDFTVDRDEIKDEIDHASVETAQYVEIHLRGRDKQLFMKIEESLVKIKNETFGICEECEEEIEIRRLKARPITTLCISCQEAREKAEKAYA